MKQAKVDFLIIGGGIAGLWLLADLKAQGYSVLLCESTALGAGQTIASQGIIHGGTKYALTGKISKASHAIADMPHRWKTALAGQDRVDLSAVQCLSENQFLWTSANIASKVTGFFASKVMQSRMQAVTKQTYPELFQHRDFKGRLYQLDEPIIDIPSLLNSLQQQFSKYLIHTNSKNSKLIKTSQQWQFEAELANSHNRQLNKQANNKLDKRSPEKIRVQAQAIVLTAGEGNEALAQTLYPNSPDRYAKQKPQKNIMQRRPLQMVILKSPHLPMIYAHALGVSDKPKLTITSHKDADNNTVWYIGGEPAEKGVGQTKQQLITATQSELQQLLPWVDFKATEWSTYAINRAEGVQSAGKRPDQPVIKMLDNVCIAWPTKLAFAPMLSDQIQQYYQSLEPIIDSVIPSELPLAKVSKTVW